MAADPAQPRRTIAFAGNCQAESLWQVYRRRVAPLLGEAAIYVQIAPGTPAQDIPARLRQLQQADVIVDQKFDAPNPIPPELFERAGVRRVRFPYLSGRLYWPYGGVNHASAGKQGLPGGGSPYTNELGDAFLNRMIAERVPPEQALRRYDAEVACSAARIARMTELHLDRQRERDTACGLEFAGTIAETYQREQLFTTQGHPGLGLSRLFVRKVFEAIGVPDALVHETLRSLLAAPFPTSEMPIHPGVANILGLRFHDPEQRYQFGDEGCFTFREFSLRYLAHTWCPDMRAAFALLRDNDFERGILKLRQALLQCAGSASAWRALGYALWRTARLDEAETAIRRALQLGPPHPDAFALLAEVLLQREDVDAADEAAREGAALFPEHAGLLHVQVKLLAHRGRIEEAVAVARVAAAREPADVGALWVLATHLRLAERTDEAAAVWRQALAVDPTNEDVRNQVAALAPPVAAPAPVPAPTARYRPISLSDLSAHPDLRIDDRPIAQPSENLPARTVVLPPLAFGATTSDLADDLAQHPAAPAWLLRNVTVHGMCGVITAGDYVIEETLGPALPLRVAGAGRDEDGRVRLPLREPAGNVHTGFHLLGARPDDYGHWLLDLAARFGATAWQALLACQGAARAPILLLPPLDKFWKWESLWLFVPETVARMALNPDGCVFVQYLLYVPRLGTAEWATHPAVAPLFDAVRDRVIEAVGALAVRDRHLFIASDEVDAAAPGNAAELLARAKRAGFMCVVMAKLSFWDQVRLFAEASHVIGAHGADLASMAFCRPGTTVCELRPAGAPWTWRHLAAMRGLVYGCLEGAGAAPPDAERGDATWRIDPDAFDALLRDWGLGGG